MYHFAGHWENKDFKKRQENHHDSLNQITRAFWLVQWLFFARIWLERTISCQLSFKDHSIHGSLFVRVKIQFTWVQMFNSQFGIIGWTEFLWLESTWSLNLCQLTYTSTGYGATTVYKSPQAEEIKNLPNCCFLCFQPWKWQRDFFANDVRKQLKHYSGVCSLIYCLSRKTIWPFFPCFFSAGNIHFGPPNAPQCTTKW